MKLLSMVFIFALAGCSTLSNPQGAAQTVDTVDYKQQIYKTSCSGAVEEWGNCRDRARLTCKNGYETLERIESPVGGKRELKFQCK